MPDITSISLFLTAAIILAITPGPGIMYVLTRSIKGGRNEGLTSTAGTAIGGLFHVVAAALGLSAILATSALAFNVIKYAGAAYLIYLGIRTIFSKESPSISLETEPASAHNALKQGIITEVLNPKTALFFLAFIPQFISPQGNIALQFILLGCISVFLNSAADAIVAFSAGSLGGYLMRNARLRQGQRLFSGFALAALGAFVAISDTE